jgi:hypothetical protein
MIVKFPKKTSPPFAVLLYSKELLLRTQTLFMKFPQKTSPPLPVLQQDILAKNTGNSRSVPIKDKSFFTNSIARNFAANTKKLIVKFPLKALPSLQVLFS